MLKNEIIAVTGVTGAGKDYLVDQANRGVGLNRLNWGSVVGKILGLNRDKMTLAMSKQIEASQLKACQEVINMQPAVVTCHTVRPQEDGRLSYNWEVEAALNPRYYAFVTADPDDIADRVARRNLETSRSSIEMPANVIEEIQAEKLAAVTKLATSLESELLVLPNTGQESAQSTQRLHVVLAGLAVTSQISHL